MPTAWDDPPEARGVSFAPPSMTRVTKALLIANVAVFVLQWVLFDGWFQQPDFEGCPFVNVLLEYEPGNKIRIAAGEHLAQIRAFLMGLAIEAGMIDAKDFVDVWHMLMKGSIIAAGGGNRDAAKEARRAAAMLLESWPAA